MSLLAINGGKPVIDKPLPVYNSIGKEEIDAVTKVLEGGCLSKFVGAWGKDFDGGDAVKAFEQAWRKQFGVAHAISVNSATSGLYAAMGAIGIEPGDEVIVPPTTMSATAMAPLVYGGIPVFADIEDETFCIDPQDVRRKITPRTKAILAVNLFGHPARLKELRALADEHGIFLIEDNAQAPLATEHGRYSGTIGHIGVFSLNYHKHIHTGEGGLCLTNDDRLALRLRAIRNHGENIVEPAGLMEDMSNMFGFNYRLSEIAATIGLWQLEKAEYHVEQRVKIAQKLRQAISSLSGLTPPVERDGCSHVYYVLAMRYDEKAMGVSRDFFSKALFAEGFPNYIGYVKPLYLLPIFQKKIAVGSKGFPFSLSTTTNYQKGLCPVAERLYEKEFFWYPVTLYELGNQHTDLLIEALNKVHSRREELAELEKSAEKAGATVCA
jgi:dTDP-4-amino-4,6-dideoxygalactose transaminase